MAITKVSTSNSEQIDTKPVVSFRKKRKQDALALAQLAYDIYKEEKYAARIKSGQNNAQSDPRT